MLSSAPSTATTTTSQQQLLLHAAPDDDDVRVSGAADYGAATAVSLDDDTETQSLLNLSVMIDDLELLGSQSSAFCNNNKPSVATAAGDGVATTAERQRRAIAPHRDRAVLPRPPDWGAGQVWRRSSRASHYPRHKELAPEPDPAILGISDRDAWCPSATSSMSCARIGVVSSLSPLMRAAPLELDVTTLAKNNFFWRITFAFMN